MNSTGQTSSGATNFNIFQTRIDRAVPVRPWPTPHPMYTLRRDLAKYLASSSQSLAVRRGSPISGQSIVIVSAMLSPGNGVIRVLFFPFRSISIADLSNSLFSKPLAAPAQIVVAFCLFRPFRVLGGVATFLLEIATTNCGLL